MVNKRITYRQFQIHDSGQFKGEPLKNNRHIHVILKMCELCNRLVTNVRIFDH